MDQIAISRAHQKNIERYQQLLKTKLSDAETQYLEKRLSEERFWMAMLNSPSNTPLKGRDLSGAFE